MMNVLPVLLKDGYKVGHPFQYAQDTIEVSSNWTPRGSRVPGVDGIIFFALQYFIQEYLVRQFNQGFFEQPKDKVLARYKRRIDNYLGPGVSVDHIAALHELQRLPLLIKALPEGTKVPLRVPAFTHRNTHDDFFWLTNMLETLMSNVLWLPCTSATTAFRYRQVFDRFAAQTGGAKEFVPWQGHDFSMRGLPGVEAAQLSGAAHLLSFTGTDTIPAIDFLEEYYGADCERELIGGSVPATEHSVMSMGTKSREIDTIRRIVQDVYPSGIVSVVCDTWDFWQVLTKFLPELKSIIMARPGKVVVRPDSGDPVKVICGDPEGQTEATRKGAIELLWDVFGGTVNDRGYKELDSHIGLIYGDSITAERQHAILAGLAANGFASTNVVLGIGSFTYQYVTRDTYGFAMKATHGATVSGGPQDIFKDPATDDGTKRSATGLLRVDVGPDGRLVCEERCSPEREAGGLLRTVFVDGQVLNQQSLAEIRARIAAQLAGTWDPTDDRRALVGGALVDELHNQGAAR